MNPPKNKTPKDILNKARKYIESTERPSITGLAQALGYADRQSLTDNKKRGPEFEKAVRMVTAWVDKVHEEALLGNCCTGSIFYLKNRGWKDNHDVKHEGNITINLVKYADNNPA